MLRNQGVYKNIIAMLIDVIMAFVICFLGLYIRMGKAQLMADLPLYITLCSYFCFASCISSVVLNVYRDIWRYFNMQYFIRYMHYASVSAAIFTIILFFFGHLEALPRSVLFINWMLQIFATTYIRMIYKYLGATHRLSFSEMLKKNTQMNSVIVIGNSPKIERFLTEASLSPEAVYKVIGVVQVGTDNAGRRISGIPILGSIDELNAILYKLSQAGNKPTRIIVDLQPEIKVLLPIISSIAQDFMVPVSRFGEASEISHNLNSSDTLRPIALEDLLARPQRCLDYAKISRMIHGKTILITGAGGSIGSEIVVQCCKYGADKVLLMDSSEFLLYEIEQLCKRKYPGVLALPRLLDIRDYEEVEKLFMQHKPHIVFHAAALKHVPLMEEHKMQALSVNVLGTFNMLEIAQKYKIQNFVFISTDKAVSPLSFMGITKRIAEILCYCLANQSMPVNIVRFGNVLGSNGSVVPLFEKQIVAGGPVTVTHPETTRYFMTIPEAVSLVLQASTNDPAKLCNTYILDMGQPIKILELAEKMIALSGLRPYVDVPIEFTGLRPGEKLHESLCVYGDDLKTTECESIFATTGEYCGDLNIALQLEQLRQAIVNKDESLGVQLSLSIIKSEKFK